MTSQLSIAPVEEERPLEEGVVESSDACRHLTAWFDGACYPVNPGGHCSWGALVKDGARVIWQESGYVGSGRGMTNNVAEYAGLIGVLKWAKENLRAGDELVVHGDSNLVINQMNRVWKAKRGLYAPYYMEARLLANELPKVRYVWIPREENTEADLLSRAVVT